jgi:hypothetical protein
MMRCGVAVEVMVMDRRFCGGLQDLCSGEFC